jgi:hypothetical protein
MQRGSCTVTTATAVKNNNNNQRKKEKKKERKKERKKIERNIPSGECWLCSWVRGYLRAGAHLVAER